MAGNERRTTLLGSLHTINEETLIKSDQFGSPDLVSDRKLLLNSKHFNKGLLHREPNEV